MGDNNDRYFLVVFYNLSSLKISSFVINVNDLYSPPSSNPRNFRIFKFGHEEEERKMQWSVAVGKINIGRVQRRRDP